MPGRLFGSLRAAYLKQEFAARSERTPARVQCAPDLFIEALNIQIEQIADRREQAVAEQQRAVAHVGFQQSAGGHQRAIHNQTGVSFGRLCEIARLDFGSLPANQPDELARPIERLADHRAVPQREVTVVRAVKNCGSG